MFKCPCKFKFPNRMFTRTQNKFSEGRSHFRETIKPGEKRDNLLCSPPPPPHTLNTIKQFSRLRFQSTNASSTIKDHHFWMVLGWSTKLLFNTISNYWGRLLRQIIAADYCGRLLRQIIAADYCGRLLRQIIAADYCGRLLRQIIAADYCGRLLQIIGADYWGRLLGQIIGADYWGRLLGQIIGADYWGRLLGQLIWADYWGGFFWRRNRHEQCIFNNRCFKESYNGDKHHSILVDPIWEIFVWYANISLCMLGQEIV